MTDRLFCKRCLYGSDHPLGIVFDEEGICSGCRIHEEKDQLDWGERWGHLEQLVKPYRSLTGKTYDCIVPVSAGQDSYYIVHTVKNRLGLNPLLVTYNKYFNTPLGITNLANLRIKFNCDILVQNVNINSVKNITRSTLRQLGSMYWPVLAGQTVFPVQMAVRYQVPLIIWGAHQGLEQVGMFSHEHEVEMTRRYRKDHDLMGHEADDLLSIFDTLREEDIWQYRYPEDRELNDVGVRGIYLGNYLRWDPKAQHEEMIQRYGYRTAMLPRTFDTYDHVDCFNYMDIHDIIKLYKNGYSKVTDHACREIRHGRLTREQGLALVRYHEQEPAKYLSLFEKWLGMKTDSLNFMLNETRNPKYWSQTSPGQWCFSGWSQNQKKSPLAPPSTQNIDIGFKADSKIEYDLGERYVIIGKGHP